ncbi:MAG TPA: LysM peptidoglycan-binding domain-containing protein [Myxococcota bacterium]|nr:LysM peptidoglycan-binding domain-containing protein [Myxococcota bacterium]
MRLERTTPLRESAIVRSGLPGRALNRIERDHGARTVGELLQLILNADIDADFQAAFGLSNEAVRTLAGDLLGALPREHASAIQAPADFVLGAELEDGGPPALSAPPRRQILPDRCSMVEDLLPVADQGRRGSCVSQAATAVNEFYQGGKRRLSSQYLYARCKEDDGYPGPGTYPRVAAKLLREEGQCTERTLPYNPNQIPGNEGQGPVPLKARLEASLYKCHLPYAIDSTDVDFIQRLLVGLEVGGERLPPRPIFFAVQTFRGLMGGETARTGRVLMPLPGARPCGGHAMVYAGYCVGDDPGGGRFIVRNSWGAGWAHENPDGPGYCWLPFAYARQHSRGAAYALFTKKEAALIERSSLPDHGDKAAGGPRRRWAGLAVVAALAGAVAVAIHAPEALRPEPDQQRSGCYSYWAEDNVLQKRVMPAETLWGLSQWFGVGSEELADWNDLDPEARIVRDQHLEVRLDAEPYFYVVQPGDTLSEIQASRGIDNPWKVKGLNCMTDGTVYAGETLMLL